MAGCDRIWEDIRRCVTRAIETRDSSQHPASWAGTAARLFDMQPGGGPPSSSNSSITRSEESDRSDRSTEWSTSSSSSSSLSADWKSAAFTQLCSKACQKWQENTTKTPCLEISIDSMKHLCLFGGEPPRWIYAKHLQNEVSDLCKAGWTNLDDTFQHVQWTPLRPPPSMRLHPRPCSWMTQQGHGNAAICCNGAEASRLCKRST